MPLAGPAYSNGRAHSFPLSTHGWNRDNVVRIDFGHANRQPSRTGQLESSEKYKFSGPTPDLLGEALGIPQNSQGPCCSQASSWLWCTLTCRKHCSREQQTGQKRCGVLANLCVHPELHKHLCMVT